MASLGMLSLSALAAVNAEGHAVEVLLCLIHTAKSGQAAVRTTTPLSCLTATWVLDHEADTQCT